MAKHDLLTEEEFRQYKPHAASIRYLDRYAKKQGRNPAQIRVLDWGCGRGRFVLWLRDQGYDAYGVDIDAEPVNNGLPLFEQRGIHHKPLSVLSETGRTIYEDGYFDFVMTNNVLEHVSDLEAVAAEINRITSSNGGGYHVFPAQRQPREGHLFMPFVHWIRPGPLRKAWIRTCVRYGIEPHWQELAGRNVDEKSDVYYRYSTDHIFYRPYPLIRSIFEKNGFNVTFVSLQNPVVQKNRLLTMLANNPLTGPLFAGLILTFKQVELVLTRKG